MTFSTKCPHCFSSFPLRQPLGEKIYEELHLCSFITFLCPKCNTPIVFEWIKEPMTWCDDGVEHHLQGSASISLNVEANLTVEEDITNEKLHS